MKPYGHEGASYYHSCKCTQCRGDNDGAGRAREKEVVKKQIKEQLDR